ncbi:hypothetical protein [Paenarthrobacter sp. CAP02]|uniref:hypothetical protein n=1 Tax=Paenarthrobacter sp. CAP02 TaxID=3158144 RepID=UPI0032D9D77A
MSESQTVRIEAPRTAERWTLFFSMVTAGAALFIAAAMMVVPTIFSQTFNAATEYEPIGTSLNAQVCGNWASFVLDQNKNGLSAEQIEAVWKVSTAKNGSAQTTPITELCGTIPQLLQAAGRK